MESGMCPFRRASERAYGGKPRESLIKTAVGSSGATQQLICKMPQATGANYRKLRHSHGGRHG